VSVVNFHCEIEPANLLQYALQIWRVVESMVNMELRTAKKGSCFRLVNEWGTDNPHHRKERECQEDILT
jgi:hypothetical protein